MWIITFNKLLKKSHRTSKIQPTFLGRLTNCLCSRQLISCFFRFKIIIHQFSKCRRNQICQNSLEIYCKSNCYIFIVKTNTKQLYLQLQKLLTDKRLCHGNNLRTFLRRYLYRPPQKKIHLPIYQDIFTYIPQVYRRYIFIWTDCKTDLEIFLNKLNAKHLLLNLNMKYRKEEFHF